MMAYPLFVGQNNAINKNHSSDDNLSYYNWTYDKKEYPKNSYTLDEICPPHTNPSSIKQFFDESDFNDDGLLGGKEISAMDYKLKHSQYTYNGPYGYN
jgi:hypothetical protein